MTDKTNLRVKVIRDRNSSKSFGKLRIRTEFSKEALAEAPDFCSQCAFVEIKKKLGK